MKKHLLSILCFVVAICALSGPAAAAPIVQTGSTYTFYLEGELSDNSFIGQTTFDNVAEFTTRAGLTLTVTESELALADGRTRIRINIAANGDLFPSVGETAGLGIGLAGAGLAGDGLDLLLAVALDEVRLTFADAAGNTLLVSEDLADAVDERSPWTGFFPSPTGAVGLESIGGRGASNITFDFFVSDIVTNVPEPSTAFLGMIGLAGAFAARRRQRKPAIRA